MPIAATPESLAFGAISEVYLPQRPNAVRNRPRVERRLCIAALLDCTRIARPSRRSIIHAPMDKAPFLDELQSRLTALLDQTPAADLQKNLKALLTQQFARLELATREEFDIQTKVLARTRAQLEDLEQRIAALEAARK